MMTKMRKKHDKKKNPYVPGVCDFLLCVWSAKIENVG